MKQKRLFAMSGILLSMGLFSALFWANLTTASSTRPRTLPQQEADVEPDLWTDVAVSDASPNGRQAQPPTLEAGQRLLALNDDRLLAQLAQALPEFTADPTTNPLLELPLPDGTFARFRLYESSIIEPALAAKYPELKTYSGVNIDDPTMTARFDWSVHGFNATITTPNGVYIIEPLQEGDQVHHVSFDFAGQPTEEWSEPILDVIEHGEPAAAPAAVPSAFSAPFSFSAVAANDGYTTGDVLRVYRLAVATTGEYAADNGGTTASVLAAIISEINALNAVWERELAIRLVLIGNNDDIVFLDDQTDPYTDACETTQLGINQTTIDTAIGSENYDIGHLFLKNYCGGVVGGLLCDAGEKAKGQTGLNIPLDTFAHEMGHALTASHTWSRCQGGTGGQFSAANAYEPGSGTTLMSYAGICGLDNIESDSLIQYHARSFDQMISYVTENATGSSCGASLPTGNTPPNVNAGSDGLSFPPSTPFVLVGSATDSEDVGLTYSWEEMDLAPSTGITPGVGVQPFFRVFERSAASSRTFPQLSDILNNTETIGEQLPPSAFTLTMRLHTYDNHLGAGGVAYDTIALRIVTETAGLLPITPFAVTYPTTSSVAWAGGATETVTWHVGNSDQAPINCALVDIDLSTDGGYTFDTSLANDVSNDGSQDVTVPTLLSGSARVRVACASYADHYFFDLSDYDFSVGSCTTSLLVRTTADSGDCSLRDTVGFAVDNDTITFDPALAGQTIYLQSQIEITEDLTIDGGGHGVTVDGQDSTRLFAVSGSDVTLGQLTFSNGYTDTANGGAIYVASSGVALTVTDSTFNSNHARYGGGIYNNQGAVHVSDSTFVGNSVSGASFSEGGGIQNSQGTAVVVNSTFADNSASYGGGGMGNNGGGASASATLINNTFSGNSGNSGGAISSYFGSWVISNTILADSSSGVADCSHNGGSISFVGSHNIVETPGNCDDNGLSGTAVDPVLGTLGDYGGETETIHLSAGSPAIDAGDGAVCSAALVNDLDQRGVARPFDGDNDLTAVCDIGAFEYNAAPAPDLAISKLVTPSSSVVITPGTSITFTLIYTNEGNAIATNVVVTDLIPSTFVVDQVTHSNPSQVVTGTAVYDWNIDDLAPGAGGQITITGHTTRTTYLRNRAVITGTGDNNPNNNESTAEVLTLASPRLVVDSTDNFSDGDYSTGENSLPEALQYAGSGDVVVFDPSIAGSTIYMSNTIVLGNDLTLDGQSNNITISGDSDQNGTGDIQLFNVSGGAITFKSITINKALNSGGEGGGLYVSSGAVVTLTDVTISENSANNGGGIHNRGTVYIYDSEIISNTGSPNVAGIYNYDSAYLYMENSTLAENDASGVTGGLYNINGTVLITGSLIQGNSAADQGGAIANWFGNSRMSITHTQILTNETTSGSGGGIWTQGAPLALTDVTLRGNDASNSGGGIYKTGGNTVTVLSSTIHFNEADGGASSSGGGGIHQTGGTITLQHSALDNNRANGNDGGGLFLNSGSAVFNISDSTVSHNYAADDAGGIVIANGTMYMSSAVVDGNSANNTGGSEGGGIRNVVGTIHIADSTIRNNDSRNDGGGILVTSNSSTYAYITNTQIVSNTARQHGGGVWSYGSQLFVTDSTIGHNDTETGHGAGIYNRNGGVIQISNSDIVSNSASNDGGGIYQTTGTIEVVNGSTINHNQATNSGGGVYVDDSGSTFNLTDSEVSHNFATHDGGGLLNVGSMTIQTGTIRHNVISRTGSQGGGVLNGGGTLILYNSEVSENYSDDEGGGVHSFLSAGGTTTISQTVIMSNSAKNKGGGLYNVAGTTTIEATTFSGNSATAGSGGGIFNNFGIILMNNSTLVKNHAAITGGGLDDDGFDSVIKNSTFSGNDAGTAGGGMHGRLGYTLQHVTFSENDAPEGAGLNSEAFLATVNNSIFANSSGSEDCRNAGAAITGSGNLVESDDDGGNLCGLTLGDPLLAGLADNGGPTETHLPLTGSPAIDTAVAGSCLATDQRGVSRNSATCDIGAVEQLLFPLTGTTSISGNDLTLAWDAVDNNCQWEVHSSASPYFSPTAGTLLAGPLANGTTSYTAVGVISDTVNNDFFIIHPVNCLSYVPDSDLVGVFHFGVTPGE